MYKGFFGLKETPFSIAPNPDFLYLGERHSEALAHLKYGLGETGGFILLTGEVGTGKTTLCRCLLQQLPEDIETAFILNPTLSELELLASICDEFKIRYQKGRATLKVLTDKIRDRLLQIHADGKKAILVIDEAQHLRGEVLEQLRLLTNLETNTSKLLKVILIGQPELQQLLKRQELRQLAQRITARYHLLPLTENEVTAYLNYRLQVAGCERQLFTPKAVKALFQYSQGIPRLLNLLSERSLLGAYGQQKQIIDHKIVKQAASETIEFGSHSNAISIPWKPVVLAMSFAVTLFASHLYFQQQQPQETITVEVTPDLKASDNLSGAFHQLYQIWQQPVDDLTNPCDTDAKLNCYWFNGDAQKLKQLNMPTILKLNDKGQEFYGIYLGEKNQQIKLALANGEFEFSDSWLNSHWSGAAVTVWQGDVELVRQITKQSSQEKLQWLENMLAISQQRENREVVSLDNRLKQSLHQWQIGNSLPMSNTADSYSQLLLLRSLYTDWPTLTSE